MPCTHCGGQWWEKARRLASCLRLRWRRRRRSWRGVGNGAGGGGDGTRYGGAGGNGDGVRGVWCAVWQVAAVTTLAAAAAQVATVMAWWCVSVRPFVRPFVRSSVRPCVRAQQLGHMLIVACFY